MLSLRLKVTKIDFPNTWQWLNTMGPGQNSAPNIKAPFTIANGDFIEKVKLYYIKGKGIVGVIYMTKKGLA